MSSFHVAIAGATGNLGLPILKSLLDAGFTVTVLSRIGGNASALPSHSNLTIKVVDLTSFDSLHPALLGIDVVISCVATLAIGSQKPIIDASVAAGVNRFIPAEFGMDSANPLCAQLPVCAPKVATQHRYWGLQMGLILNLEKHTATLYNGGNVPFSATTLEDVASAVLGVIRHQSQTANRIVYVHSAVLTQNQLIGFAKDIDGKAWETISIDTE
ncbi:hypothetical protein BDP81DRAFT_399952 [Colletotrichum phormii]|uniref:NmrA-like domain-containing protein n=1 Tax=Colletotrichum phormii TaxID=359342 RepID=A0AAJ0EAI1_9PEZI|nr:uncharacterized protein BDP81DRAFT_399952 [Colletotrichum phormii]KAK1622712.1 hypothetical protein BDP81DRAFT_399952 [Colletotrichum phormii]